MDFGKIIRQNWIGSKEVILCLIYVFLIFLPANLLGAEPSTIDEAVKWVENLKKQGVSDGEIADKLTKLVDNRMDNANTAEGVWRRGILSTAIENYTGWEPSEGIKTHKKFLAEREKLPGEIPGRDYEFRAKWAWNNRYGNCAEATTISYYILKKAGFKNVKIMGAPGHNWVVLGMKKGADVSDPRTWGKNSRTVDGWLGKSLGPNEAYENKHIGNSGKFKTWDGTTRYDDPVLYQAYLNRMRKKAKAEAKKKAEAETRKRTEEEARKKAEEETRKRAEAEAKKKAEAEAKKKAEEARKKAEEEVRKATEDAVKKAVEEAKRKAEEARKKKAEEEARKKAEEEAKRKIREDLKKKQEEKLAESKRLEKLKKKCGKNESLDASGNCVFDPRKDLKARKGPTCQSDAECPEDHVCINYSCMSSKEYKKLAKRVKERREKEKERLESREQSGAAGGGEPVLVDEYGQLLDSKESCVYDSECSESEVCRDGSCVTSDYPSHRRYPRHGEQYGDDVEDFVDDFMREGDRGYRDRDYDRRDHRDRGRIDKKHDKHAKKGSGSEQPPDEKKCPKVTYSKKRCDGGPITEFNVGECPKGKCFDACPNCTFACKQEKTVPNSRLSSLRAVICNEGYTAERNPCPPYLIQRCVKK